jgi:uncharacterized protein with HEPN domain
MLDANREALSFVVGKTREDLNVDRMLTLSCVRLLEVIGEAASQVSAEFRARYPDVPWNQMTGMRNRLIHAYFDVNLDVLWETLADSLPSLVHALEDILQRES